MELIIKKQIGKQMYSFVVQGKDFHEVIMESEKLSFPDIFKCGLCDSETLYLNAYITKEDSYKYVKVVCAKCKGQLTFGQQKKKPGTWYLRRNDTGKWDWQKSDYKPEENTDLEPF